MIACSTSSSGPSSLNVQARGQRRALHLAVHERIARIAVAAVAALSTPEHVAAITVVGKQLVGSTVTPQHVPVVEVVVGVEDVVVSIGQYAVTHAAVALVEDILVVGAFTGDVATRLGDGQRNPCGHHGDQHHHPYHQH